MHIEPEVVTGAKLVLSYGTAAGAAAYTAKTAMDSVREKGVVPFAGGAVVATALTFVFFQVFPHFPVGVSEENQPENDHLFRTVPRAPSGNRGEKGIRCGAKAKVPNPELPPHL